MPRAGRHLPPVDRCPCRLGHVYVLTLVLGRLRIAKCDPQPAPVITPRIALADGFHAGVWLPLDRIRGFLFRIHPLASPAQAIVDLPGKHGACALLSMFGGKIPLIREQRVFLADI